MLRDLRALTDTVITHQGKTFAVRSSTVGVAGKIAQCLRVRLLSVVRQLGADVAAMAAGTADTELQVEQVVLRIHPAPEAPHGATADFDLVRLRDGQETLRERWSLTLRFDFLPIIPSELVVYNPMGILITLPAGGPGPGHGGAQVIAHLRGREEALEPFGWMAATQSGSRWRASTAACSPAPNSPPISGSIAGRPFGSSGPCSSGGSPPRSSSNAGRCAGSSDTGSTALSAPRTSATAGTLRRRFVGMHDRRSDSVKPRDRVVHQQPTLVVPFKQSRPPRNSGGPGSVFVRLRREWEIALCLVRCRHAVADAVLVEDVGGFVGVVSELPAESLDRRPYAVRVVGPELAPHPAEQDGGGHDVSGVQRQDAEQIELDGGERDRAAAQANAAGSVVDGQLAQGERRTALATTSWSNELLGGLRARRESVPCRSALAKTGCGYAES